MTARRERDALAPSLFPFLAVLLCTMGSLVLILMLIVSGAQAAANRAMTEQKHRREELESDVQRISAALHRELDTGRIDLEKQRLVLQHYEEHILELMQELEQLDQAKDLLNQESQEFDLAQVEQEISELEEQLLEATKELEQEVDKPEGDKPVFAIVPYQGPNGTHRRPIYLECDSKGVRIQPEGNLLTIEDLRPPHGPGNPLDAALRAIRSEYKPANGAVTDTAYPLLVVRPSGIRAYALARSALGSWDEQFGYELIGEDLDLVFPDGVPGLEDKIATAIRLAQQRQAALVMAMPNRFQRSRQQAVRENGRTGMRGGGNGVPSPGGGSFGSGSPSSSPPPPGVQELSGGSSTGGGMGLAGPDYYAENPQDLNTTGAPNSMPGSSSSRFERSGEISSASEFNPATGDYGSAGESYFGDGTDEMGRAADRQQLANNEGQDQANGAFDPNGSPGSPGGSQSGGQSGGTAAGQSSAMAQNSGPASAQGGSSGAASSSRGGSLNSNPGGRASQEADPSNPQEAPQIGVNVDLSQNRRSQSVASTRGSGWAWSQRSYSRTTVVRTIQLQCLADRWVVLPDRGTNQRPVTIPFEGTPQQRAEKLATTIRDRVESWGIALAGGYWKPEIAVEVGQDADWRFDQLRQLMDASGIEIRQRVTRSASGTGSTSGTASGGRRR